MKPSYRRGERRWLMLALLLGFPLFLILVLCLPNIGPVLRVFAIPSRRMAPALPLGSYAVVSRASYGYSRYSFDDLELPITGRLPTLHAASGATSSCFGCRATASTQFVKRVVGPARRPHPDGRRAPVDQRRARAPRAGGQDAQSLRRPLARSRPRSRLCPTAAPTASSSADGDAWPLREHRPVSRARRAISSCSATTVANSTDSRVQSPRFGVGFVPIELVVGTRCSSPSEGGIQWRDHARAASVLFSGGQDSTVCLAWALERYARVETVGFAYGQRHAVELDQRPLIRAEIARQFPAWGAAARRRPRAGARHARRHQRDRADPRRPVRR